MDKLVIRKRKNADTPLCKYGASCYQKNPEHRKKFKHPPVKNKVAYMKDVNENSLAKVAKGSLPETSNNKTAINELTSFISESKVNENIQGVLSKNISSERNLTSTSVAESNYNETVNRILETMPEDFFDFWSFCSSLNKLKPEDAFWEFGFQLVGVYDLLAKKLPPDQEINISCHWRYYYDPPEFQTVIKKNEENLFHIGYFRDDPAEMPFVVASNCAALGSRLQLEGDNIFAAMNTALKDSIKSTKSKVLKNKAHEILKKLEEFTKRKNYSLDVQTDKTKKRQKTVVAKTFHGLGIVVPVKNDVGYRPLTESNAALKNIFKKIVTADTEAKRLDCEELLDVIISNIHFANDECDYGMGLELGIDLFCFGDASLHNYVLSVLPLAYDLLNRQKYANIIKEHLKNRKKGSKLSTINT